jgi:hypothetical protein
MQYVTDQMGFGPTYPHRGGTHNWEIPFTAHYGSAVLASIATGILGWYGVKSIGGNTVAAVAGATLATLVGYTVAARWDHPHTLLIHQRTAEAKAGI